MNVIKNYLLIASMLACCVSCGTPLSYKPTANGDDITSITIRSAFWADANSLKKYKEFFPNSSVIISTNPMPFVTKAEQVNLFISHAMKEFDLLDERGNATAVRIHDDRVFLNDKRYAFIGLEIPKDQIPRIERENHHYRISLRPDQNRWAWDAKGPLEVQTN